MKRIGLAIAAAMLGTTGVASAGIAVHQFTVSSSTNSEGVALSAQSKELAANCWLATGGGKAAGCNTSAAATLPGQGGVEDDLEGEVAEFLLEMLVGPFLDGVGAR